MLCPQPGVQLGATEGKDGVEPEPVESRSIHVLLVDDDTLARQVVRKALEKFGYQVTVVVSAQQALQVLDSTDAGTFQLILSDVVMPEGGDGLDLLEQLKSNPAWNSIPVVMMSANECVDTVRECLQHGACHYIVKPATHKEIKNIWQYAFRGSTISPLPGVHKHPSSVPATHPATQTSTQDNAAPTATSDLALSAVDPTAQRLPPSILPSTSTHCPLNTVLDSNYLPWNTRLTIFCHLLNTTLKAFQNTGLLAASPHQPPSMQRPVPLPFTSPTSVLVSSSGDISTCSVPSSHFSTPFYTAPEQHSAAPTSSNHLRRKPYDSAQATYALGVLLMELAIAPVAATDRAKHLAALPRLPVQLLSSKPKIAVLVLQMTAEQPQDRVQLARVAAETSIAEVYSMVVAEDTAAVAAAAVGRAHLRRSFLLRAEEAQRIHVAAVSADLRRIEEDFKHIAQALQHLDGPTAAGTGAEDKSTKAARMHAHDDSSSQQQRLPACAIEWPAHVSRSRQSPVAMMAAQLQRMPERNACDAANACVTENEQHSNGLLVEGGDAEEAAGSGSGSEEGSNQQPMCAGQKGGCADNASGKSTTGVPGSGRASQEHLIEGQQGSGKSSDDQALVAPSCGNHLQPLRGPGTQHCAGEANGADHTQAGCVQHTQELPQAEDGAAAVHSAGIRQRGLKRGWSSWDAPITAAGEAQNPEAPAQCHAYHAHSISSKVPQHVRLRWQHIEPVAMHLFDSYRKSTQACAGAALQNTQPKPIDTCMELHGQPAGWDSMPSFDQRGADAMNAAGGGRACDRIASVGATGGQERRAMQLQPWLEAISGDLQAVSRFRSLDVVSVVQPAHAACSAQHSRRMVSALALDRCDHIMAIVGITNPLRLYRFNDICSETRGAGHAHFPAAELNVRTKPTSACFNPYLQNRLVVSDTEGGVMIMDTNAQHDVMQLEEHASRVWAVDSSPHDPSLLLSASADRTVRLWCANSESSVGVIAEASQVCSASFCPTDANLLAVASGCFARLYDIRRLDTPLGSVTAPKAASYVRFMGKNLVAASVDSVLCMYDTEEVARATEVNSVQPVREFRGHINARNFVGLACSQAGYIFTGSENNSVVMYHRSVSAPVAQQTVVNTDALGLSGGPEAIVSCVAVTAAMDHVVAGGTTGWVNVMKLKS